jgi:hypothetical protein
MLLPLLIACKGVLNLSSGLKQCQGQDQDEQGKCVWNLCGQILINGLVFSLNPSRLGIQFKMKPAVFDSGGMSNTRTRRIRMWNKFGGTKLMRPALVSDKDAWVEAIEWMNQGRNGFT